MSADKKVTEPEKQVEEYRDRGEHPYASDGERALYRGCIESAMNRWKEFVGL